MKTFISIVMLLVGFIITPLIIFWVGFGAGWLAKLVVGNQLCYALNTLFGTARFDPASIPWVAGALCWCGAMLKAFSIQSGIKKS